MQRGHEKIHHVGELLDVVRLPFLADRDLEPELQADFVERVRDLGQKLREIVLIGGVDPFPVQEHPAGVDFAQPLLEMIDEAVLGIRRTVREVFHGFGDAAFAGEVGHQRQEDQRLVRQETQQRHVVLAREVAVGSRQTEPLGTNVRELVGMSAERVEAAGVPSHGEPEPYLAGGARRPRGAGRNRVLGSRWASTI